MIGRMHSECRFWLLSPVGRRTGRNGTSRAAADPVRSSDREVMAALRGPVRSFGRRPRATGLVNDTGLILEDLPPTGEYLDVAVFQSGGSPPLRERALPSLRRGLRLRGGLPQRVL